MPRAKSNPAQIVAILDEAATIGPLQQLVDAWAMAPGAAGLSFVGVYQSLAQIKNQTKAWESILANSTAAIYFGVRSSQDAGYISKQCGVSEILNSSRSVTIDRRSGEPIVNDSMVQASRPLLHLDEICFGLGEDEALLISDGLPGVVRARRIPYTKIAALRGKYRPNPYFTKPPGWLRRFWMWLIS